MTKAPVAEDQFRLLVNSVEDYAIFLLDGQGNVASWNIGARMIKGYLPEEIIGKHVSIFYTPEDRAAKKPQRLLEAAAQRGRVEDEAWRIRKDGSRFWANVVITALRDEAGKLVGFGKVTRDLTARREMEEQLRRAEERLSTMIASVADYAIFMLDPDGIVLSWNPGAERIKGYKADEIIGEHFSRFFTEEDLAENQPNRELAIARKDGRFEDESWRVRKNGSRFWANVVISAVRDAAGELIGFTKVTRDLTERKKMEEDRLQHAQAEEALRLRDEFLSIASHELKTPLTALQLQLHGILEQGLAVDANLTRRIERAARSGDRLGDLIESLLDVSRIATGRLSLDRQPFDLVECAREVIERLREAAEEARCVVSLEARGPIVGSWDRLRVEQMLVGLLANAFRYASGAPVVVRAIEDDSDAVVDVRDRGPGLPEGDPARLFGRFERASSVSYGGFGLGLYLIRQIVEAHGGTIAASNLSGGGASFLVRLPRGAAVNRSTVPS